MIADWLAIMAAHFLSSTAIWLHAKMEKHPDNFSLIRLEPLSVLSLYLDVWIFGFLVFLLERFGSKN